MKPKAFAVIGVVAHRPDSLRLCTGPAIGLALAMTASADAGLTFNISYTAAVQGNADFASIQAACNYVANEFSTRFNDNITLNFTVDQNNAGLGSSLFS